MFGPTLLYLHGPPVEMLRDWPESENTNFFLMWVQGASPMHCEFSGSVIGTAPGVFAWLTPNHKARFSGQRPRFSRGEPRTTRDEIRPGKRKDGGPTTNVSDAVQNIAKITD